MATDPETSAETGKDEAWWANTKRLHDEFLNESLESIREGRKVLTRMTNNAVEGDHERQKIGNQSLQNAVETANMLGKAAVNGLSLFLDRSWNLDEVSKLASQDTRQVEALATIMAVKLAELLGTKKE